MKRLISVLLIAVMCVMSVFIGAGCGGGEGDDVDESKTTVIEAVNFDGGIGTNWLRKAAERFEAKVADKSFEDGKMGVHIKISPNMHLSTNTMDGQGYHIYFDEASSNVRNLAQQGFLLDITDIVTAKDESRNGEMISIEDKLTAEQRANLKGNDGKYYGLPHYQWHPGVTYDRELFDAQNLYFADESETNVKVENSKYGTARFIKKADGKKSVGSDGVYGTKDDGLPSSLEELILLCAYMKKLGVEPMQVSGMYKNYMNYLILGLWSALAGYDEMRVVYDFEGEINLVTGFTDEPLFKGIDYIKKPIIEKKVITKENAETEGKYIYQTAARYYAASFVRILQKEGWMSRASKIETNSHIDAQSTFIFSGKLNNPKVGMLIDGSYWYNESVTSLNFKDYYETTQSESRDVRFLPLPTSLNESGKEGINRELCLIDSGLSYGFINSNIQSEGLIKACKEFFRFLYTDEELRAMTVETGAKRTIDYQLTEDDLSKIGLYQKDLLDLTKDCKILFASADNATFLSAESNLHLNIFNIFSLKSVMNGKNREGMYALLQGDKYSVEDIFMSSGLNEETWAAIYKKD